MVENAARLFDLTAEQAESLANRAGLSLGAAGADCRLLPCLLRECTSQQRNLLYQTVLSERMLQYYMAGRQPGKQVLLAILILLNQTAEKAVWQAQLGAYGYCLSDSLANDLVVRWFLSLGEEAVGLRLLNRVNTVLYELNLPLLLGGAGKSYR